MLTLTSPVTTSRIVTLTTFPFQWLIAFRKGGMFAFWRHKQHHNLSCWAKIVSGALQESWTPFNLFFLIVLYFSLISLPYTYMSEYWPLQLRYTSVIEFWITNKSWLFKNVFGLQTKYLISFVWESTGGRCKCSPNSLRWRHNGRESVSNHQPHDCLLNRLFRRR